MTGADRTWERDPLTSGKAHPFIGAISMDNNNSQQALSEGQTVRLMGRTFQVVRDGLTLILRED